MRGTRFLFPAVEFVMASARRLCKIAPMAQPLAWSSNNTNAVATLDTPFTNDPPTLADLETMRAKMNEMLLAARRT